MNPRHALLVLLGAAAVLDGCACEQLPTSALTACKQGAIVQGAVKTDILFVVDNSGSMSQEVANLKANLNAFVAVLKASPVANDFQIGITTVAVQDFNGNMVGLQGKLIGPVTVATPTSHFAGPLLRGDSATISEDFAALVDAAWASGTVGKEQPLRAMKLALSSPLIDAGQPNAGFLRPGARLAVIFLSDEDDNSETLTGLTSAQLSDLATCTTVRSACSNPRSHNAGTVPGSSTTLDGIDYKFTVEDRVADYVAFLNGAVGGEVRDVVLGAIVGIDPALATPNPPAPSCGDTSNVWCCGGTLNATSCGTDTVTLKSYAHTVTGPTASVTSTTYCYGGTGGACTSGCATAYDKADRFVAFMGAMPWNKTITASICDTSFATSLQQIAGLIISPTVPISGEPADPAMLVVRLQKTDGSVVSCKLGSDYTYAPASGNRPATITFLTTGACALAGGDQIKIDVICAG